MTTAISHRDIVVPLIASLYRMAWLVEARDPYTGGHLWRVSQFSRLLAEDLALPNSDVARITLGGFLHDLGKIGVPDAILNKPGKLDDDEYAVIKTHPAIGARLLTGHPLAELVQSAVAQHHEMPNGRGYPEGLLGDAIPIDARIVGLADAFDAMTSTRPYRSGMEIDRALSIIADAAGTQFDADLAARLIKLGQHGALDHFIGHSDLRIPLQYCVACGPTMVVQRHQRPGDAIYCRSCGAEAMIDQHDNHAVRIHHTGHRGNAAALEPQVDEQLVAELSEHAGRLLAASLNSPA